MPPAPPGGIECRERVLGSAVGDLDERLAGRGVLDGELTRSGAFAPLATDQKATRHAIEHRPLVKRSSDVRSLRTARVLQWCVRHLGGGCHFRARLM